MMTYRVFEVPEYHEFLDILGITPDTIDEHGAGRLTFQTDTETLAVTFDPLGRSFHCRWSRHSAVVVEIFREGATRLRLRTAGNENYIAVDFETDSEQGYIELQVSPVFTLRDQLLWR
jgi:hypothetical protein